MTFCTITLPPLRLATAASITTNSSASYTSPPRSHPLHPVPPSSPPPHYSHPVKKRKVVLAQPPQSYRGFTADPVQPRSHSGTRGPVQWRSKLERAGRPATEATARVQPSGGVRKVQRVATSENVRPTHQPAATRKVASGTDRLTGATITTSSWRVGKDLTDRILKRQPGLVKPGEAADTLPTVSRDTSELSVSPPAAGMDGERGGSPSVSPPSSSGGGLARGATLPTTAAKLLEDLAMLSQDEEEGANGMLTLS